MPARRGLSQRAFPMLAQRFRDTWRLTAFSYGLMWLQSGKSYVRSVLYEFPKPLRIVAEAVGPRGSEEAKLRPAYVCRCPTIFPVCIFGADPLLGKTSRRLLRWKTGWRRVRRYFARYVQLFIHESAIDHAARRKLKNHRSVDDALYAIPRKCFARRTLGILDQRKIGDYLRKRKRIFFLSF